MSRMLATAAALIAIGSAGGCGGDDDDAATDGATTDSTETADGPDSPADARPGDDGGAPPSCTSSQALCLDHRTRRYCAAGSWQEESCQAGWGCVAGACVEDACSDECNLGDVAAGRDCELYDIESESWGAADPAAYMHDRSRAYNRWLRRDGMAYGGVGNALYSDPGTYSSVSALGGLGDSSIWTGTYLAAEAMRLRETGSAEARANVISLVETLHLWFNVSGAPGNLARFVAPTGAPEPPVLGDLDCASDRVHCGVSYDGAQYDYIGHISRDQYQGVMLGYALAYEALGEHDEATRALIRDDVVELVNELMTERTVPMLLTWNGSPLGPFDIDMRFVVLNPDEMEEGAVQLIVDTDDYSSSEMFGFQEFIPELADIIHQFPPPLSWWPTIPRSGSAVMLASFFQIAMLVTDGVPGFEDEHDAFVDYYENNSGDHGGNVDDWLEIAKLWSYSGECGASYYANNIVMEPLYNLARLESDPTRRQVVLDDVLDARMWAEHQGTKNSFFYFIYAGTYASASADIGEEGAAQLSGFPPPPRVRVAVNLLSDPDYQPLESGCDNQVTHSKAVDVADRVVSDFIWQRHPWGLVDAGNPAQTYPGVDYLAAYWFGRHHGFIEDDTPTECLVWRDN